MPITTIENGTPLTPELLIALLHPVFSQNPQNDGEIPYPPITPLPESSAPNVAGSFLMFELAGKFYKMSLLDLLTLAAPSKSTITGEMIADEAITWDKIYSGAVKTSAIANYAVTELKIAAGAVTESKLSESIQLAIFDAIVDTLSLCGTNTGSFPIADGQLLQNLLPFPGNADYDVICYCGYAAQWVLRVKCTCDLPFTARIDFSSRAPGSPSFIHHYTDEISIPASTMDTHVFTGQFPVPRPFFGRGTEIYAKMYAVDGNGATVQLEDVTAKLNLRASAG